MIRTMDEKEQVELLKIHLSSGQAIKEKEQSNLRDWRTESMKPAELDLPQEIDRFSINGVLDMNTR